MLKLFFTGLIIYAIYRYFIASPALGRPREDGQIPHRPTTEKNNNEDYVDYEEVD